jgi:hypothetical protein
MILRVHPGLNLTENRPFESVWTVSVGSPGQVETIVAPTMAAPFGSLTRPMERIWPLTVIEMIRSNENETKIRVLICLDMNGRSENPVVDTP